MAYNSYLSVVQSGLSANKPTTPDNPTQPCFYHATDTNVLWKWNTASQAWDSTQPKSVAVGAALTAPAVAGVTYLLNQAGGSVLTLPPATGSGLTIEAVVSKTTTSAAHKILAGVATDDLIGAVTGATVTSKAALTFSGAVAGGFHSLQMPFAGSQPSGGFEGDWFSLQDVAAGVWVVQGMFQSGTTPTTPFSTATS